MKNKDIGLIVLIGVLAGGIGLLLVSKVFSSGTRTAEIEQVKEISSEFSDEGAAYFDRDRVNKEDYSLVPEINLEPQSHPFQSIE